MFHILNRIRGVLDLHLSGYVDTSTYWTIKVSSVSSTPQVVSERNRIVRTFHCYQLTLITNMCIFKRSIIHIPDTFILDLNLGSKWIYALLVIIKTSG